MLKLFCCFSFSIGKKSANPILWKETTPFVPPIESGIVIKVYDGDTITVAAQLPYPESPLYRFQVRLAGIDSPEIKGKTEEEKTAAHKAQEALETLVLHKTVLLKNRLQEKYGRILAEVYLDDLHVNQWLLDGGFAVPYDGKTKTAFESL
jgi:endonuclease YncB( thermonuclease family)